MGRPLKIAKAQAVITLTATNASTEVVTTSADLITLGIIAGMPIIPASNIGGLVANTTYWILKVLTANTFTVSATPLNANPTSTPVNLSGTTGQIVAATVAPVDAYFNNPNGPQWPAINANTYSVVGGDTAIIGNQVLCNVAIGQNGTGAIIADTASNVVVGVGTDFANVASGTILFAVYGAGQGPVTLIGTTSAAGGDTTVAVANTQNTGNIIRTSGNAQTLVEGGPVTFSANLGGLVTGTTYWVLNVANASAFTVSTSPNGPEVDLSSATGTPTASQQQVVLTNDAENPAIGVTSQGDPFIQALPEAGYIIRQKGKQKYLVKGTATGLVGACYTANVANTALTPNTMTITATYANANTQLVQSLSDHTVELFTSTSGPVATGNIVLQNAAPAYATFNSAVTANAANGQPYPIVSIGKA